MARNARHLSRRWVVAVILLVVLIFPIYAAMEWLKANHPRAGFVLFCVGYGCVIALLGLLALNAWMMVIISYRYDRSLPRGPWTLYSACLFSAAAVCALIYLVREAMHRAI